MIKGNAIKKKLDKKAEKPHRAKSVYLWYYTKNFKTLAKESSGTSGKISIKEVAKLSKDHFSKLSPEAKKEYEVLAEQDKIRYDQERKKKYLAHRKAKYVITPYIRFANEVRNTVQRENPKMKMTEISKIIGGMWKELDSSKKKKSIKVLLNLNKN